MGILGGFLSLILALLIFFSLKAVFDFFMQHLRNLLKPILKPLLWLVIFLFLLVLGINLLAPLMSGNEIVLPSSKDGFYNWISSFNSCEKGALQVLFYTLIFSLLLLIYSPLSHCHFCNSYGHVKEDTVVLDSYEKIIDRSYEGERERVNDIIAVITERCRVTSTCQKCNESWTTDMDRERVENRS